MDKIIQKLKKFNSDRDWKKFHTPRNLAISISLEAAEVLEKFQWKLDETLSEEELKELKEEIADVFLYTLQLSEALKIDLLEVTEKKMIKNALKSPVKSAKGSATKYTKLKKLPKDSN